MPSTTLVAALKAYVKKLRRTSRFHRTDTYRNFKESDTMSILASIHMLANRIDSTADDLEDILEKEGYV